MAIFGTMSKPAIAHDRPIDDRITKIEESIAEMRQDFSILLAEIKRTRMSSEGAVVGSTAFFITHGFREQAEHAEKSLMQNGLSDWSKILYLEVIDATFSIDGVLGAFAFTLSVPLILLGNGLGALVVRQLTIGNVERIKKYLYLKNGAMYSVLFLGIFMVMESFGCHMPVWLSPLVTCGVVAFFFIKSRAALQKINP